MDSLLLEQARIAKARADQQEELIASLPELERQAKEKIRRAAMAEQKAAAKAAFEKEIEALGKRDEAFEANYLELKKVFRSFVAMLKSDNRSYESIHLAAMRLGYFLATEDQLFGLSADSQRAHAEQLLSDNDIKPVNLPQPKDAVDNFFNEAIIQCLNTIL